MKVKFKQNFHLQYSKNEQVQFTKIVQRTTFYLGVSNFNLKFLHDSMFESYAMSKSLVCNMISSIDVQVKLEACLKRPPNNVVMNYNGLKV
jgi:hypothetical protein